ncbi:uncharacterized protein K452DRAFT_323064 [Aplosporella prunicola CBS 121167]|uniref:asparaginase n=1 Tax=Aplosporella prunicola CBS 121167 TaxID=1176127 RepID=A0A6A6AU00_9PEZI|nr:uncharacterized protein K452DRAFT_323064 [Aplosporella prunicola CBS 121167]KAF2135429.1 hypothetical protein K452DRAFT_323064 [Aplosporella prunicola CBS 121167]
MFSKTILSSALLALPFSILALPAPASPALFRRDAGPVLEQDSVNASLPNVTIYATGGTIASKGETSGQTVGYSVGLGVKDLVDAVPEILNISNIYGLQVANVGSQEVDYNILLALAHNITKDLAKEETTGVVVTHGTDNLEETAFFLDLVINSTKPVVVVGSMRPATALSADGPLNLYQAVTLAASEKAKNRGAMIVLNDRIGAAFYATKNSANSLDTFYATEQGQLGFFINQVPYFYYTPAAVPGKPHFSVGANTSLPQVDIIYTHEDNNPALVKASIESGSKGIVFAGSGAGSVDDAMLAVAEKQFNSTHTPMVVSHRTVDGFVPVEDVQDYMIPSGFLNPQKARVLLQLAVNAGYSNEKVREVFDALHP